MFEMPTIWRGKRHRQFAVVVAVGRALVAVATVAHHAQVTVRAVVQAVAPRAVLDVLHVQAVVQAVVVQAVLDVLDAQAVAPLGALVVHRAQALRGK